VSCGDGTVRQFLTKEERIEMLKEYKESLEKEVRGIQERIEDLEEE
jgi:FtsZ-binding cell division protein ZapB